MTRRIFTLAALGGVGLAARSTQHPRDMESAVLAAANRERALRGIPELAWSDDLAEIARLHSQEMQREQFFSHTDPQRGNLAGRMRGAGIKYRACAENIYRHYGAADAAEAAVAAWMDSQGHRLNLLGRAYRKTAAGVAIDSRGRCLVTQIFLA